MLPLVVVSAALGSTQTTIHDLQLQVTDVGSGGSDCYPSGASSNTEYSVDGVVTAVQAPNGFYMQMYDLQPVSWSGIWVYAPQSGTGSIVWPANLAVGDSVHVTGTCSEYFGMTEINAHEGPSITRSGSGTQYIDPISVTTGAIGTTCSDSAEPCEQGVSQPHLQPPSASGKTVRCFPWLVPLEQSTRSSWPSRRLLDQSAARSNHPPRRRGHARLPFQRRRHLGTRPMGPRGH